MGYYYAIKLFFAPVMEFILGTNSGFDSIAPTPASADGVSGGMTDHAWFKAVGDTISFALYVIFQVMVDDEDLSLVILNNS